MRALSPLGKKKSGLSNIVGYVLLISITISLSVLVYGWLRFYVTGEDIDTCSENVNIIIRSYSCSLGVGGNITVNLKNKGLFTVDGYELRVHDRENASFGVYLFDDKGVSIAPGVEHTQTYRFDSTNFTDLNPGKNPLEKVTLLEIQPFMVEEGSIRCKSHASQEIICTS